MYPITMAILLFCFLGFFSYTAYNRISLLLAAKGRDNRFDHLFQRFTGTIEYAGGQIRLLLREPLWGLMHAFIFWGFLVVAIRTITLFGIAFSPNFNLPFMNGVFGNIYALSKDIFQVLVTVGVIVLLIRRIFIKPKRLTLSWEANLILIAIAILMITDFLMEGAQIAVREGVHSFWTPVGVWFAAIFSSIKLSSKSLNSIFTINYFIHTIGILIFLNYLPYGKHFHIITAIPNVFFRKLTPYGALSKMDLEDEKATTFGVEKINEFNWKQFLDLYTCTECGRCEDQCPAYATDKPLSPKKFAIALRDYLYKNSKNIVAKMVFPLPLVGRVREGKELNVGKDQHKEEGIGGDLLSLVPKIIDPEILWSCTTCRACEVACPIFIEYVDKIVDMRRNLVLMKGEISQQAQTALKNIETNSNPWGIGFSTRGDWAKDLGVALLSENKDVEYLYFVGCAGSFDERAKKVSRAFVHLLKQANISFGILGAEEKCTGDSARRIGNEYLFQMLAKENIETFNRYGIKKIITTCPHCYNTIKNEYPQFGGHYDVIHHTELLSKLVKQGKIKAGDSLKGKTITYHDSCYLGRYNKIYNQPREIINSIDGIEFKEINLSHDTGRCCGAGGGRMWMEENIGTRINHKRLEDITTSTDAEIIATACPFCLTMLSDAVKDKSLEGVKTCDVAELLE